MEQKKWHKLPGIIIAVFIVLIVIFILRGKNSIKYDYFNFDEFTFLNLEEGKSIEQKFSITQSYLHSISLFFVNIFPGMDKLVLEIYDLNDNVIFAETMDASQLLPGEFNKFYIRKHIKKNKNYILKISYGGQGEDNYLGIMAAPSEKNLADTGQCIYGGEPVGINIVALYETSTISLTLVTLSIAAIVIIAVFVFPEKRKNVDKM